MGAQFHWGRRSATAPGAHPGRTRDTPLPRVGVPGWRPKGAPFIWWQPLEKAETKGGILLNVIHLPCSLPHVERVLWYLFAEVVTE